MAETTIVTVYLITETNATPIPENSPNAGDEAATSNLLTITATYYLESSSQETPPEERDVDSSNIPTALPRSLSSKPYIAGGRGVKPTHVEGSFIIDADSDDTDVETGVPNSIDALLQQVSQVVQNAAARRFFKF